MSDRFDTSGEVYVLGGPKGLAIGFLRWPDLSPFTQGYVEALYAQHGEDLWRSRDPSPPSHSHPYGFSDLAPETLARIVEDCATYQRPDLEYTAEEGANMWAWRNMGEGADYGLPPLTPYLGNDGKVYLREGA